jgi:FHS family L-fucose permease-like MFS transporter
MQIGPVANTAKQDGAPAGVSVDLVAGPVASLRVFVFALFFIFGGITSLNDVIIPKLKDLFTLSYAQAMLVQSAFFAAYFIVSLPAAAIVRRVGYMRAAVAGLVTMIAGCLLFIPAASSGIFITFLLALFVLAAGITIVQVVANPLISMLGAPSTASSRLTFAQAFNSLGTAVFPYVGAVVILGSLTNMDHTALSGEALALYRAAESQVVVHTYIGLAITIAVVAALVWISRNKLVECVRPEGNMIGALGLFSEPRFAFGALCIFLYVGAEVAIGSLIVNFLMQHDVLGLGAEAAGKHVPIYWSGAMIGRFVGAYVLRICSPGKVLACAACLAIALLAVAVATQGPLAGWAMLAVGFVNSIMFPTIFTLASEGLGERAPEGSGLICMAIVGGAVIPLVTGYMADATGLRLALAVPAFCYLLISVFGWYARRPLQR